MGGRRVVIRSDEDFWGPAEGFTTTGWAACALNETQGASKHVGHGCKYTNAHTAANMNSPHTRI